MISLSILYVFVTAHAALSPGLPAYTADFPGSSRIVFSSNMGGTTTSTSFPGTS